MSLAPFSKKHTPKKILVSCAGLGMGNASRISAILEALNEDFALKSEQVSIHVISWGAGYLFLKHFREVCGFTFELTEIRPYDSFSLRNFISTYLSNSRKIKKIINKINPDLMILDSDYHFLSWLMFRGPKISIAQARDVVDRISHHNYSPANFKERIIFFLREELDAFFQKCVFDKVLIPSFYPEDSNNKEIKIPLIVRAEFLKDDSGDMEQSQLITILLSGSQIDKDHFLKIKNRNFKIISPDLNHQSPLISRAVDLDNSEIIFTQGGLSSISEALARKKFVVIFPINNHPEQAINSLEVEKSNAGLRADVSELKNLDKLLSRIDHAKSRGKSQMFSCEGARVAVGIINKLIA